MEISSSLNFSVLPQDCALVEAGVCRNEQVDYYINGGLDTHFYIDGEEI